MGRFNFQRVDDLLYRHGTRRSEPSRWIRLVRRHPGYAFFAELTASCAMLGVPAGKMPMISLRFDGLRLGNVSALWGIHCPAT